MRAAAFVAGAVVATGLYLAIAAALALSPTWIGLGILAIATLDAVIFVMGEGQGSADGVRLRPRGT
jgi:hypothetical protein